MSRTRWMFQWMFLLGSLIGTSSTLLIADDVNPFEGYLPGLVGTYRRTDSAPVETTTETLAPLRRIDGEVAFDWGTQAPHEQLDGGEFSIHWRGTMLVKQETTYRLHAWLSGGVNVSIDGKVVLKSTRAEPGWVSGEPTAIDFGFLPISIDFTAGKQSAVKLFWSAEGLPLEPLPWHQLFHETEGDAANAEVILEERGRQLFDVYRCNRCHQQAGDIVSPEAPPFLTITADLDGDWLRRKLRHQHSHAATSQMPAFDFDEAQANALATWLEHFAQPPKLPAPPDVKTPADAIQEGAALVHSLGCLACHRVGDIGSELTRGGHPFSGGDLSTIGSKRSVDWIYTWLRQPDKINPAHQMPSFELKPSQQGAIARYLASLKERSEPNSKANDDAPKGNTGDDAAPDNELRVPGDRPGHPGPPAQRNTEIVIAGRQLAYDSRCANCHKTPAHEIDLRGIPKLDAPVQDWEASCLGGKGDSTTHRPYYPQADRIALKAYLVARVRATKRDAVADAGTSTQPPNGDSAPNSTDQTRPRAIPVIDAVASVAVSDSSLSDFERGRILLDRRNCLACHERGSNRGIVPIAGVVAKSIKSLRGTGEELIPPNLTAVGDRMTDAALSDAVAGEQKQRRMPWLKVQMPKFKHHPEERAALMAYLTGTDRIPSDAPDAPYQKLVAEKSPEGTEGATAAVVDAQTLLASRELVGAGGFSCIACHKFGDYEPKHVAPGSRGSDLKGVSSRVRREFFLRWCRSPLSIVPGVEMPSYESRPVKGVMGDDIDRQLAALWSAINDPKFEAPTNPSQVEQLITLQSGDSPRIIRDVFTVSKENGGGVAARAFAVGFDNGHSLLYDLDAGAIREWRWGDFARQRTEGKSWYWDMAGQNVMSGFVNSSEILLHNRADQECLPRRIDGRFAQLRRYEVTPATDTTPASVELAYDLFYNSAPIEHLPSGDVDDSAPPVLVQVTETLKTGTHDQHVALIRDIQLMLPQGYTVSVGARGDQLGGLSGASIQAVVTPPDHDGQLHRITLRYLAATPATPPLAKPMRVIATSVTPITSAPGLAATRLPLPAAIMPTAITWTADGTLAFTSLKGQVYLAKDTDGDGVEDRLIEFEEGLPAPFGILEDVAAVDKNVRVPVDANLNASRDSKGLRLLVVTKGELLRLTDVNGDGRCDLREVLADGWGYTDNYHDWVTGPVRDTEGNLYLATGSDYSQGGRDPITAKWKGKVLKLEPEGSARSSSNPLLTVNSRRPYRITPIADELRYPMGIAFDPLGRLFVSDQQGVANTFNEIDHIVPGRRYGVRALLDQPDDRPETPAAVQVPHPFTRSVNGIFFIPHFPPENPLHPFAGHGIGCEYDSKFLLRFSLQEVAGELQGATYLFTQREWPSKEEMLLGPLCGAISPEGDIVIGSIHDSGWLGGLNTGEVVRLRPPGNWPNGVRELRATPQGFEIEFLRPVDPVLAKDASNYELSAYTRKWEGSYATPDSERHTPKITRVELKESTVILHVDPLREGFFYELNCSKLSRPSSPLFPATATYTMNRIPPTRE